MDHDRVPRPEKFSATFRAMLCLAVILPVFLSCNKKEKWIDVDPAFSKYIYAYTTGIISKPTTVRTQLATDATPPHAVGEVEKDDFFYFSPAVKGKAFWLDARTVEFKPESWLN